MTNYLLAPYAPTPLRVLSGGGCFLTGARATLPLSPSGKDTRKIIGFWWGIIDLRITKEK